MRIQLTRKLADYLDGIDVSDHREGDVFDLPGIEAHLLIAERWAVPFHGPTNVVRNFAAAADSPTRRIQTVEQLRRVLGQMETKHFEQHERRRAEDRYREELQESRAKTVSGKQQ